MGLNILILIYVGSFKPMKSRRINKFELTNEYLVGICTINLVSFTQRIQIPRMRYNAGWVSVLMLMFLILINGVNTLYVSACVLIKHLKYYKLKI